MLATNWATISVFATAVGTLVLAIATFAAVRSANRAARISEAAFRSNLRPVLVTSRLEDPVQKIRWMDDHWARVDGSQGLAELVDGNVYLAISLRNVGSGLAVPIGWHLMEGTQNAAVGHSEPGEFRAQTRDLYVAPGDVGFWQAAIRERNDPDYSWLSRSITDGQAFTIDLLYGDNEGGQRTMTRFGFMPGEQVAWLGSVTRHTNVDRDDPR